MSFQLEIQHANEKQREVQKLKNTHEPDFAKYSPDIEEILEKKEQQDFDSLVVIGNGGSITSFRAFLYAFLPEMNVDVRPVTTTDPDFLNRLSRELDSDKTLVMPISKSGETSTVIEATLFFMKRGFDIFPVTGDNNGALKNIVDKRELEWVEHPNVGGRFSGATETALVPAAFAGLEVSEIRRGAENMYEKLSPENNYNPALNAASAFYDLESRGYNTVFSAFYSTRMFGYMPLFIQLMHETVCKEGQGQTVTGDLGPEYQHHTNQRIFGGREDIVPVFFTTGTHEEERIEVPEDIKDVSIRGRKLEDLNGLSMQQTVDAEYNGVRKALDELERPYMNFNLTDLSHKGAGEMLAFLQYLAVYSAWLRDVNPFTQPDVERSKELGFKARFER